MTEAELVEETVHWAADAAEYAARAGTGTDADGTVGAAEEAQRRAKWAKWTAEEGRATS